MTAASLIGLALTDDSLGETGADIAVLVSIARDADRLGFDFLSLDDPFARAADGAPHANAGEALAFLARKTDQIALVPGIATHYAEPFHAAKQIATLDFLSGGRAGVALDSAATALGDRLYPAAHTLGVAERAEQASEFTRVLRELWDSWEDGATVRDRESGQYVDSARVHSIDHDGTYFRVRGPLITPRPPQGQPPVFVRVRDVHSLTAALAGEATDTRADVLLVEPELVEDAVNAVAALAVGIAAVAAAPTRIVVSIELAAADVVSGARAALLAWRNHPGVDGVELRASGAVAAELLASWEAEPAADAPTLSERLGIAHRPSRYASA
ncbi:LLM class flavin-dependent oxidoreductase [Mycetocola tolaasinivorans]|uniref:LLM class flavin-dependent oxidoreductase n=1 Tax=Mycetocola tolaasinivorans TaxID=76635 RepID=A0A3L7A9Z8_9MICO|nr:LLM class flavin-dependent oxidoreductase [Mycetocola tolaasinivorans]RLP76874.1 LLM class flavin-dependent oxidoreductase [Mycetocola tolaasinivorans]